LRDERDSAKLDSRSGLRQLDNAPLFPIDRIFDFFFRMTEKNWRRSQRKFLQIVDTRRWIRARARSHPREFPDAAVVTFVEAEGNYIARGKTATAKLVTVPARGKTRGVKGARGGKKIGAVFPFIWASALPSMWLRQKFFAMSRANFRAGRFGWNKSS